MIWRNPVFQIVVAFITSRVLFFLCGIRFDDSVFEWGWQLIDADLLRHKLTESIFFLHSQPPLFNLYLGIVLKLFKNNYATALHISFMIIGLLQIISMYLIMDKLNVAKNVSLIITIIFIFSPFSILYENWLFYTYPTMTLLCLSALALHQFLSTNKALYAIVFNILLCMIVLTRSIFHIAWFAVILIMLLGFKRFRRKMILSAFIPFVIALSCFVKNYILFNTFSTSSWFGMNISNLTVLQLNDYDKQDFIRNGILSPISSIATFQKVSLYRQFITKHAEEFDNIDVLVKELKSNGTPNRNHINYLEISEGYKKDALAVIRHKPLVYLRSVLCAIRVYFMPPSQYDFSHNNRKSIARYSRIYETLFLGSFVDNRETQEGGSMFQKILVESWTVILLYMAILYFGISWAYNLLKVRPRIDPARSAVFFFMLFNILYVGVTGNLFEVGENMRFHFLVYPFLVVMLGLCITLRSRSGLREFPWVRLS
jgi:hypothetical protein